jgi:hypothetical protein
MEKSLAHTTQLQLAQPDPELKGLECPSCSTNVLLIILEQAMIQIRVEGIKVSRERNMYDASGVDATAG